MASDTQSHPSPYSFLLRLLGLLGPIPLYWQKVGQCQASPSDTFEAITDMLVSVSKRQNNLPNYAISSGQRRTVPWTVRICSVFCFQRQLTLLQFFLWH